MNRNYNVAGKRVLVAGCGPLGSAFATHLERQGAVVGCICDISASRARRLKKVLQTAPKAVSKLKSINDSFDIIVIAVPDDAIAAVAQALALCGCVKAGTIAYHPSGVLPADILIPLQQQGAHVAAFHPIQTFSTFKQAVEDLPGAPFDVQGDKKAVTLARKLVKAWGGMFSEVSVESKALLHVASVFSSNFVNVLQEQSASLLARDSGTDAPGLGMMSKLTEASVRNGFRQGPVAALTGPVARGDVGTITLHIEALLRNAPELLPLYRQLSLAAADMAKAAGKKGRNHTKVRQLLKGKK